MQFNELWDETQQLLQVHGLSEDFCTMGTRGMWQTACHTSDTGAACECVCQEQSKFRYDSCRVDNCSRNCSPILPVSCSKTFPPSTNGGVLSRAHNETGRYLFSKLLCMLSYFFCCSVVRCRSHWPSKMPQETLSALLVNGTKATFDHSELQVLEHPIEFDCHQSVEVVIGVEYAFEMLCPYFDIWAEGSWAVPIEESLARMMSLHGLLWKQSAYIIPYIRPGPFVRLVALESALVNSSDAWVNVTLNYSSTSMLNNYYVKPRQGYIDTPVHLSIHITRQEPASQMWSPEAISVPCLVEQKAFELVVKFTGTGRMSDLRGQASEVCTTKIRQSMVIHRSKKNMGWKTVFPSVALRGDSYFETPLFQFSGTTLGDDQDGSLSARFHTGPVADVLWSRPGRQSYEMPQEELAAWRLRRNQSGKPSDHRIIHSIQARGRKMHKCIKKHRNMYTLTLNNPIKVCESPKIMGVNRKKKQGEIEGRGIRVG